MLLSDALKASAVMQNLQKVNRLASPIAILKNDFQFFIAYSDEFMVDLNNKGWALSFLNNEKREVAKNSTEWEPVVELADITTLSCFEDVLKEI